MPNLENLKKQAKQILRWHRTGHYPVAALIRASLPRYRELGDAEVMALSFKLSDAQEVVAAQAGFPSWEALKRGLETMETSNQPLAAPRLEWAEPQLFVADILAARDFYKKLGFEIVFSYGEPPFYAQVRREGARLNLRCVSPPPLDRGEDLLSASIVTNAAKALFVEFEAAGVEFRQRLRTEPWGARTFIVEDPDGNLLLFAGDA